MKYLRKNLHIASSMSKMWLYNKWRVLLNKFNLLSIISDLYFQNVLFICIEAILCIVPKRRVHRIAKHSTLKRKNAQQRKAKHSTARNLPVRASRRRYSPNWCYPASNYDSLYNNKLKTKNLFNDKIDIMKQKYELAGIVCMP